MWTDREKLHKYTAAYFSGLYTKSEAIGAMLEVLEKSPDFRALWTDVPDWAQSDIWPFLKQCDETTVLYNFSSQTSGVIDPNLIALKNWLISEKGYE